MLDSNRFDTKPKVASKTRNQLPPNPDQKTNEDGVVKKGRFPSWLHRPLPKGNGLAQTSAIVTSHRLHTVCEEAKCPNLLECWTKKTATFLIMGKQCTRACGFCDIDFAKKPPPLDPEEPQRVAASVQELNLKHVVITMVARDDLIDGGAAHLIAVIRAIRVANKETTVEILTSDFNGNKKAWELVASEKPEIFNYNIETVRSLTPRVRHTATYDRTLEMFRSLNAIRHSTSSPIILKSGIMVGLGESQEEVKETIKDLKDVGVNIVTVGQYLQPNRNKLLVKEFITPEQFKEYERYGYSIGIKAMYCGPFVRSSYNADNLSNFYLNL